MPLRRFVVIGAALIGEDGVRDVTIAPRNDAAAVAIGGKSWRLDIRLSISGSGRWVFRPHIGLLTLRSLAGGDVRAVATNGLESGRFQGFKRQYVQYQVITVRCGIFFGHYGEVWNFFWGPSIALREGVESYVRVSRFFWAYNARQ